MARPKPPPDPASHLPCSRCKLAYPPAATWPDGSVCVYCYRAAHRTRGRCHDCGHDGVLPGRNATGRPTCRGCSGIRLSLDCRRCGAEEELYRHGLCWRCALTEEVNAALAGTDGTVPEQLKPLATALASMPRANSGLTWIRFPHVQKLMRSLAAGETALDHDALDALPASRTVEYVRGLLMEHAVLPHRDKNLALFTRWLDSKLTQIDDPAARQVIERFSRWHLLRRLCRRADAGPVPHGAFLRAKQSTTVATGFLAWLRSEHDAHLEILTQAHVDKWHASGPSTRSLVDVFLYWARNQRLISAHLTVPRRQDNAATVLGDDQQLTAIRRILTDDELRLPVRISAGLVLLFGQAVQRLVTLRLNDVDIGTGELRLRLGHDWLAVPDPFATLLAAHLRARPNMQTAAHRDSQWVFPDTRPASTWTRPRSARRSRTPACPPEPATPQPGGASSAKHPQPSSLQPSVSPPPPPLATPSWPVPTTSATPLLAATEQQPVPNDGAPSKHEPTANSTLLNTKRYQQRW